MSYNGQLLLNCRPGWYTIGIVVLEISLKFSILSINITFNSSPSLDLRLTLGVRHFRTMFAPKKAPNEEHNYPCIGFFW